MVPFGLLGRKLGHSRSPEIHAALGDYEYRLIEIEPEAVGSFLAAREFAGLNVTVPYKRTVIEFLDELTDRAREIGSVNTVLIRDGRLIGDNTDAYGFEYMLRRGNVDVSGKKVIVLGSGGASAAVKYVLRKCGAEEIVTMTHAENNYENISRHSDADVLVNTTPVGMWPSCDETPLPDTFDCLVNLSAVLDIVANPLRTSLMLDAEREGITNVGGLHMLVAQAAEASRLFVGVSHNEDDVEKIVSEVAADMSNIVLVGMPGCGKSSVGKKLADLTGRKFIDSDELIVERAGKTIPEIFSDDGEDEFRRIESEVLRDVMSAAGQVVATGGGCVTRDENYNTLRRSGTVVYIERRTKLLSRSGRPLSEGADLDRMFEARRGLYAKFADITVKNDKTVAGCAKRILNELPDAFRPSAEK